MAVPTLWLQPSQWFGFPDHYTREKDEAVVGIRAFNCVILTCALIQSTIYGTWQGTSPHFTDTDIYSAPGDVLLQAMRALSLPTMLWDAWALWPWGALRWLWRICLTSSVGQWTPYVLRPLPLEVGTLIILISKMRMLRPEDTMQFSQGTMNSEG